MRKHHEFNFDGVIIKVTANYDEQSGKYINEFPDFEEEPIYTPHGQPIVSAVQDRCKYVESNKDEVDCGLCQFYRPNHPGDLIGVCINEKMKQKV